MATLVAAPTDEKLYRVALRKFFEVNRHYVTLAALKALADDGTLSTTKVEAAIAKYGINAEKPAPWKT